MPINNRNNEAARGLSEFNNTKIEIARADQMVIGQQNRENKIFRAYTVAKEMWNSAVDPDDKNRWYNSMNTWAAKITQIDEDLLNDIPSVPSVPPKSTPTSEPIHKPNTSSSQSSSSNSQPSSRKPPPSSIKTQSSASKPPTNTSNSQQQNKTLQPQEKCKSNEVIPIGEFLSEKGRGGLSESDSDDEAFQREVAEKAKQQRGN